MNSNFSSAIFATISVPISNWWSNKYSNKRYGIEVEIAKNNLNDCKELLSFEFSKIKKEIEESYAQMQVHEYAMYQAKENLRINENNFNAGIIDINNLLEAYTMIQQSLSSFIDSYVIYRLRLIKYEQYVNL